MNRTLRKLNARLISLLALLLLISGCASGEESQEKNSQLPTPVMLSDMIPAGEIEIGETAVLVLEDPMSWDMANNDSEIVELQSAIDDGQMTTNFAVIGRSLGTANLYAERDGVGQSFTVEVVERKRNVRIEIAKSGFFVTLPSFLAQRVEFVDEESEMTESVNALSGTLINYLADDGQPRYGSFAYVLKESDWEASQNPNQPPLGREMARIDDRVLVIAGPQDLPFNERYSNDANRFSALATLLRDSMSFSARD